MLSDPGKRLRVRKRLAELAAIAPAKENEYKSGAAATYDMPEKGPHNKNQKNHRGNQ